MAINFDYQPPSRTSVPILGIGIAIIIVALIGGVVWYAVSLSKEQAPLVPSSPSVSGEVITRLFESKFFKDLRTFELLPGEPASKGKPNPFSAAAP
ncbi:MAG: hypothetical protein HY460_01770 [Parcubacteria group bacterium]|nr:hypothetical protein [Parcubacteria group bacterium]